MKKVVMILTGIVIILSGVRSAVAVTLDFEDLSGANPPGQDVLTDQYASLGVIFSSADTDILAWDLSTDWNSTVGIRTDDYQTTAPYKMTFSVPVRYVNLGYIGNYGTGTYGHDVYLELYNASGMLIGIDYDVIAPNINNPDPMTGLTATSSEDAAYALFGGHYGFGGWNSLYYDNITFRVPEPTTICLLGLCALVLLSGNVRND